MAFKCPSCQGNSLEIDLTLELPPNGGSDEITLQTVRCERCGFRGIAVYEESRRGSLTGESIRHLCYEVSEKDLQLIESGIGLCPDRGNKRCQCETHLSWARLGWLHPRHVTIKRWFRMEWVKK